MTANPLYPFNLASGPGWIRISLPDGYDFYQDGGAGWVRLRELSVSATGPGYATIRPQLIIPDQEIVASTDFSSADLLAGVPTHRLGGSFRISTDRWPVFTGLTRGSRMILKVPPILFRGQFMLPSPLGDSFVVEYDGSNWLFKPNEQYQSSPFPLHVIPTPFRYAATLIRPDGSTVGPLEFKVEDGEALFVDMATLPGQSDTITSSLTPYTDLIDSQRLATTDDLTNRAVYYTRPEDPSVRWVDLRTTLMAEHLTLRLREYPSFFTDRSPAYVRVQLSRYPFTVPTGTLLDGISDTTATNPLSDAQPASTEDWLWLLINNLKRYRQFSDAASLQSAYEIARLLRSTNVIGDGIAGVPHSDGHWHVFEQLRRTGNTYAPADSTYSRGQDQALASWAFLLMHAVTTDPEWRTVGLGLFRTVMRGLSRYDTPADHNAPFWVSGIPYGKWFVSRGPTIEQVPLDSLLEYTLLLTQGARILQDLHLARSTFEGYNLFDRLDRLWAFWGRYKQQGGMMPRGIPYTHLSAAVGSQSALISSEGSAPGRYQPWRIAKIGWAIGEAVSAGITTDHPVTLIERLYAQSLATHLWSAENATQDGVSDLPVGPPHMLPTSYIALARQTLRDLDIRTEEIIANQQAVYGKPV
ncbi:hypothetical protein IHN63_00205 [Deinococcus sp. 6YEL10]|uniref:hypothetical protein n=1 Tax=Deinococcus sp. 6YEL10 TaxID=2745870 RepID=UPI001E39D1D0|nr:hypothetical protein [Deinococcus sp. 6YEL10]MCD0159720.1 hypothetical protein [Deinococcus sp. 6YEL10]